MDRTSNCTTDARRAPSTLELAGMAGAEAERQVAAIWCVLEAHALASPIVEVRSANALVIISLTFESADDCQLVKTALEPNSLSIVPA
jgi:hypothetical protein